MIGFEHVSVRRENKTVLTDISFTLRRGKVTALLGKNGSGKSTLLSCVNRLCPYEGRILLNDRDLLHIPAPERARLVALFPQILPDTPFSVAQLASLGRTPHAGTFGSLTDIDLQKVQEAISLAGMTTFADRPCNTLSGGERQRAFLAMLLAQDTPLLLLDEPATFLDADAAKELYELIVTLARGHEKTVLAVMHDLSAAVNVADDIAILDGGSLAFFGTTEECLASHTIERVFSVTAYHAANRIFLA